MGAIEVWEVSLAETADVTQGGWLWNVRIRGATGPGQLDAPSSMGKAVMVTN